MISKNNELMCYKKTDIDSQGKVEFFLKKHSTKEGTWGKFSLTQGSIEFVLLNGDGEELSRTRVNENEPGLSIPPASWHKIIPASDSFKGCLEFYCMPHRYYKKKYGLGEVHSDLLSFYQLYLSDSKALSMLDVGCGSGRNLLYLNQMGHHVTGIDQNQLALESINEIAKKEGLSNINTLLHDLNQSLTLEQHYDVVLSTVALQFLTPKKIPELLFKLKAATKTKGYHFLVFPIQSELYSFPEHFTYLPQKDELYHAYQNSGWSILSYKESVGHLHKKDAAGRFMAGLFGVMIAQKNG